MYYILDRIDNQNKIIYMQFVDNLVNNDVINDYYRILQYANDNNYIIKYINDKDNIFEDPFQYKYKRL